MGQKTKARFHENLSRLKILMYAFASVGRPRRHLRCSEESAPYFGTLKRNTETKARLV